MGLTTVNLIQQCSNQSSMQTLILDQREKLIGGVNPNTEHLEVFDPVLLQRSKIKDFPTWSVCLLV